jgi:hypothetical protein
MVTVSWPRVGGTETISDAFARAADVEKFKLERAWCDNFKI